MVFLVVPLAGYISRAILLIQYVNLNTDTSRDWCVQMATNFLCAGLIRTKMLGGKAT